MSSSFFISHLSIDLEAIFTFQRLEPPSYKRDMCLQNGGTSERIGKAHPDEALKGLRTAAGGEA